MRLFKLATYSQFALTIFIAIAFIILMHFKNEKAFHVIIVIESILVCICICLNLMR